MVFFLDLNYFDLAITKKKSLLNKCLVTAPLQLEHVEDYIHNGYIQETKYRQPWNRVTADDTFLKEAFSNSHKEAAGLSTETIAETWNLDDLNSYSVINHDDSNFSNIIDFELSFDVIPSSNPSSPECETDTDQINYASIVHEYFQKETLPNGPNTGDGDKLEEVLSFLEADVCSYLRDSNLGLQQTSLEKLHADDPFTLPDGSPLNEKALFGDQKTFSNTSQRNCNEDENVDNHNYMKEEFVKQEQDEQKENILDDMILDEPPLVCDGDMNNSLAYLKSTIQSEDVHILDTSSYSTLIVSASFSNSLKKLERLNYKQLSESDVIPKVSFLDINEIICTEVDLFCEDALLNSPIPLTDCRDHDLADLSLCSREPLEINFQDGSFLDESQQRVLREKCFGMERYCDHVQAARLTEPVTDDCRQMTEREDCVVLAHSHLNIKEDNHVGLSELDLHWSVCSVKAASAISSRIVRLETFSSQEHAPLLPPVEVFDKYVLPKIKDCGDEVQEESKCRQSAENIQQLKKGNDQETAIKESSRQLRGNVLNVGDFDPLGQFMALRSVTSTITCKQGSTTEVVVTQASTSKQASSESLETSKPIVDLDAACINKPAVNARRKKIKHHVVDVKLTVEFRKILQLFEARSVEYMKKLITSGDIPTNTSFKSLDPDISQFLIKQRKKYLDDNHIELTNDDIYRTLVCLFGLVGAADFLINCCLESTIAFLSALQDKYKSILKNSLEELRQQLFELKARFIGQQIHHPRVAALCREVETWLRKKKTKCQDNEQKILILVKRNLPSLLSCLKSALSAGHLLSTHILTSTTATHVIEILDDHNCLIGLEQLIQDTFPWSQFSLVVEYEHKKESPWQQLCARQQIRHFALNMVTEESLVKFEVDELKEAGSAQDQPVLVVVSHKITEQTKLLQQLEARHNILLIERDYTMLELQHQLYFPDIDVDECTCVMVEEVGQLLEDGRVQALVTKVVALSLKYTEVWLLMYQGPSKGYQFSGHAVTNLSKLQAALTNFMVMKQNFKAKVVLCADVTEVASTVHDIVTTRLSQMPPESHTDWLDRSWITGEITLEEKILLTLPTISSFNAQKMISKIGLGESLSRSARELTAFLPNLSSESVQLFTSQTSTNYGLQLNTDVNLDGHQTLDAEVMGDKCERRIYEAHSVSERSNIDNDEGYRGANIVEHFQDDLSDCTNVMKGADRLEEARWSDTGKAEPVETLSDTGNIQTVNTLTFQQENSFANKKWNVKTKSVPSGWNNVDEFVAVKNTSHADQSNLRSCRDPGNGKDALASSRVDMRNRLNSDSQGEQNVNNNKQLTKTTLGLNDNASTTFPGGVSGRHVGNQHIASHEGSSKSDYDHIEGFRMPQASIGINSGSLTFDYNHGLPYSAENCNTGGRHSTLQDDTSNNQSNKRLQQNCPADYRQKMAFQQQIQHLLTTEFPPFDEIDTTEQLPFEAQSQNVDKINMHVMYRDDRPDVKEMTDVSDTVGCVLNTKENSYETYSNIPFNDTFSDSILNGEETEQNIAEERFVFNPQTESNDSEELHYDPFNENQSSASSHIPHQGQGDSYSQSQNFINSNLQRQGLKQGHDKPHVVINSNLQRLSLKPNLNNERSGTGSDFSQNLADQLRETTRKYLENAQQFSRFRCSPHPRHQLSIGLAQPLMRGSGNRKTPDGKVLSSSERCRMAQSPWTSDYSPPMDLDYDSSSQHTSGEQLDPGQPPAKKRILTYRKVPGKKGQTKLVFQ